ncbi:MAG: zinc-binding dehydrogenase [Proteobacteria bacterium]|nr:zinc-binding dehydrogenase [Pseudomonadota bacterium]
MTALVIAEHDNATIKGATLRPVIDSEYALDHGHAALDRLESGAQFGKVVLRIEGVFPHWISP